MFVYSFLLGKKKNAQPLPSFMKIARPLFGMFCWQTLCQQQNKLALSFLSTHTVDKKKSPHVEGMDRLLTSHTIKELSRTPGVPRNPSISWHCSGRGRILDVRASRRGRATSWGWERIRPVRTRRTRSTARAGVGTSVARTGSTADRGSSAATRSGRAAGRRGRAVRISRGRGLASRGGPRLWGREVISRRRRRLRRCRLCRWRAGPCRSCRRTTILRRRRVATGRARGSPSLRVRVGCPSRRREMRMLLRMRAEHIRASTSRSGAARSIDGACPLRRRRPITILAWSGVVGDGATNGLMAGVTWALGRARVCVYVTRNGKRALSSRGRQREVRRSRGVLNVGRIGGPYRRLLLILRNNGHLDRGHWCRLHGHLLRLSCETGSSRQGHLRIGLWRHCRGWVCGWCRRVRHRDRIARIPSRWVADCFSLEQEKKKISLHSAAVGYSLPGWSRGLTLTAFA